jgi:hypothetical protein
LLVPGLLCAFAKHASLAAEVSYHLSVILDVMILILSGKCEEMATGANKRR